MIELFFPLLAQATTPEIQTVEPPPPPAAKACQSDNHAAFDFWLGEWEVYPNGNDTKVAESRITKLAEGCVVHEQWMPLRGLNGTSISHVDHQTGRWSQTWVGGNGVRVMFEGGTVDGAMVLSGHWDDYGGPGKHALVRMTLSKREDGSVRQHGEASGDQGKTWATSFDLIYRPKQDTP